MAPDGEHGTASMEQLTSVCGSFEARVLVARLYDEGIDAELRGALDSPYGFTVGELARIDVFVPEDQAEAAQFVLLADAVDAATELPEPAAYTRRITWPSGGARRGRAGRGLPRRPLSRGLKASRSLSHILSDRGFVATGGKHPHRGRRTVGEVAQPASRPSSSAPLMRRNARPVRLRSRSATSSWSAGGALC